MRPTLRAYTDNPAYDCVFTPPYTAIYDKHPNKTPPFGIRIKNHLTAIKIDEESILPITVPKAPPWELSKVKVIMDLRKHKKSETNHDVILQEFAEIKFKYADFSTIYTDGSKDDTKVAAAAVHGTESATCSLPSDASIFTAEAKAIILALKFVQRSDKHKFLICSDSLSCLLAIQNSKLKNGLINRITYLVDRLVGNGKDIVFLWVPSHVGIHGNTVVDRVGALDNDVDHCRLPYTDFRPAIRNYIFKLWCDIWDSLERNKLRELKPLLGESHISYKCRKDQVVMTRCRIGHSRFTHEHLLKDEPAPECIPCDCKLSVKHVLIDCVDFALIRKKYYTFDNMLDLFRGTPYNNIINFLREIGLYNKF